MEKTNIQTGNDTSQLLKVVIYGPESTGKTTLAKDLAEYYKTNWVPEYMRKYLEEKWKRDKTMISQEDLIPIAKGQLGWEDKKASQAEKLLICDTNLLELKVYSEYYYDGFVPDFILNNISRNKNKIYLLTAIDVPWEPDFLRDRPFDRENMFKLFENELKKNGFRYFIIEGNRQERLQKAITIIDKFINQQLLTN